MMNLFNFACLELTNSYLVSQIPKTFFLVHTYYFVTPFKNRVRLIVSRPFVNDCSDIFSEKRFDESIKF